MCDAKNEKLCWICGSPLSGTKMWPMWAEIGSGPQPFCISCQDKIYNHLAKSIGYKIALFICCAQFNVPYVPGVLEDSKRFAQAKGAWGGYITALRAKKYDKRAGGQASFLDGITDFNTAFGGELPTLCVSDDMLEDADYTKGRAEQTRQWGPGPDDAPYTQRDYDTLDATYDALTTDRPYRSEQCDLVIQDICRWTVERDRCMAHRDYDNAKKIDAMIDKAKESEQLRKRDSLPQDSVRIDDIIQAIERAGIPMMDYDELCETLANKAFHAQYPYTRDAADQMLLLIRNATAWNEGMPQVNRLPDEFAVQDPLGEFAEEPDEVEKKVYKELQLPRLNMPGD